MAASSQCFPPRSGCSSQYRSMPPSNRGSVSHAVYHSENNYYLALAVPHLTTLLLRSNRYLIRPGLRLMFHQLPSNTLYTQTFFSRCQTLPKSWLPVSCQTVRSDYNPISPQASLLCGPFSGPDQYRYQQ